MNEEHKANYYAMIPAYIRYNNQLKFAERLMYGEITALSNKEGYCFASNRYFANLYGVSQSTISRWISHLAELNSIKVEVIRNEKKERRAGILLVTVVLLATGAVSGLLLWGAYAIAPMAGCILESIMTYQILATKCLKVESMKVYERLRADDLAGARNAVAMIVGRDTQNLDAAGVAKAAVETVAENTSDGVIAPMICLAIGGPVLGFLYKAVNTMDSMVGYKNERYLNFGRTAAKLDDVVNYIPARISAALMIAAAYGPGKQFSGKDALRIFKRDRYNHASPNSAQTEAACAGALHLRLAGDASYFGKIVKKPFIGDDLRPVEAEDIVRVNVLLYRSAVIGEILCLLALLVVTLF